MRQTSSPVLIIAVFHHGGCVTLMTTVMTVLTNKGAHLVSCLWEAIRHFVSKVRYSKTDVSSVSPTSK